MYHNTRPPLERTAQAMSADLPFRVVRSNSHDETLARCTNLPIAQAAYRAAARMYPDELIELRQGARVIERSKQPLQGLPWSSKPERPLYFACSVRAGSGATPTVLGWLMYM
jgi:hypothetical protein